jgi:hypothetical protein
MIMIARLWRYERQGQNAQEIARLAGELLDKVTASLGDFALAGQKMGDAMAAQNNAIKRLSDSGFKHVLFFLSNCRHYVFEVSDRSKEVVFRMRVLIATGNPGSGFQWSR